MDILELIKKRKTIRKYKNKAISKKILAKIFDAGIWGPSVPSFLRIQPWKFIVIEHKKEKGEISDSLLKKSKTIGAGANILLHQAADVISGAAAIVVIYNSGELDLYSKKFRMIFEKFSKIIKEAEAAAISAAIQNMILVSESLGIGSCWLDTPLFCEKEINKILKIDKKLVAILTLGYADELGRRSPRKPISESVKIIK